MNSRLKKLLYLFIVVLLCYAAYSKFISWNNNLIQALTPDPIYNTDYSEKFSQYNFDVIKIGDDLKLVYDMLGEPIKIDTLKFVETMLYTICPNSVFFIEGSSSYSIKGDCDSPKFTGIFINKEGKAADKYSDFFYGGVINESINGLDKSRIIELYGEPQKHMICDGNRIVLEYTKLKKGPYRGKRPVIFLKRIIVKNGIVEKKVDCEDYPYNPYSCACAINSN